MKGYNPDSIRNIALLGHGGCGKTTFLEAALLATGVITRLGRVEDGNTVSDFDKMEIEKGYSISAALVPVEYNKVKINFVDTPWMRRRSWWTLLPVSRSERKRHGTAASSLICPGCSYCPRPIRKT